MNQQRSRRFRASKETTEKIYEIERIRSELIVKGASLPPEKPKEAHFDSNCITPVSNKRKISIIYISTHKKIMFYIQSYILFINEIQCNIW